MDCGKCGRPLKPGDDVVVVHEGYYSGIDVSPFVPRRAGDGTFLLPDLICHGACWDGIAGRERPEG